MSHIFYIEGQYNEAAIELCINPNEVWQTGGIWHIL